jgi:hypothetical protein
MGRTNPLPATQMINRRNSNDRRHCQRRSEHFLCGWSGHRAYMGQAQVSWLTTDWVLSQLAGTERVARRRYAAFIAAGQGEGYRTDALIPIRLGWSNYLERKANRLKVQWLDDYNSLKPVSNQYKPGPIERMLILSAGQQQLLRSL